MQDAISAPKVGGIVRLTRFIVRGTFLIELIGMVAMLPVFCRDHGFKGIWMAVFHSVSAFCNAGFDILRHHRKQISISYGIRRRADTKHCNYDFNYRGRHWLLTWDDICTNRWHFKNTVCKSKAILVTSVILIIVPCNIFFLFDFRDCRPVRRSLASLFQSVTPRTAGFNTADLTAMTESSKAIMILLMLVGGSPGSTRRRYKNDYAYRSDLERIFRLP